MSDSLFIKTLNGEKTERPPVWFMRQAGRVLPDYLKLREQYSFNELMHSPQLAAKVTLLPVYDLGVDAAITQMQRGRLKWLPTVFGQLSTLFSCCLPFLLQTWV